jgi:hypothetical protein
MANRNAVLCTIEAVLTLGLNLAGITYNFSRQARAFIPAASSPQTISEQSAIYTNREDEKVEEGKRDFLLKIYSPSSTLWLNILK